MTLSRHSRATKALGLRRYRPQSFSRLMPKLVSLLLLTWSSSPPADGEKEHLLLQLAEGARIMQSLK